MDDNIETLLLVLLTFFLVFLNGFFVATEFALVKVRATRIKELADNGNSAARLVSQALLQLDAYLSATQIGITLASLGLGWIGEPVVADKLIAPLLRALGIVSPTLVTTLAFAVAFGLITFAHVVYGELAPKSLAIQRAEGIALWVMPPMRFFCWVLRPLIIVLNGMANLTLRLLGLQPVSGHDLAHSEEELRMIITASGAEQGGTIRETQAELLDNVFDFGHRLARQVMIHRTEILALDVEEPLADNISLAQAGGHSRYPLVQEALDSVLGFVHTKDLFALYQRDPQGDIRTIRRDLLLVPETIRVDLLLRQMQRARQHMAILVDEYGGTAGLVTVADLLEELVGDLPDEFEPAEEAWIIQQDTHSWSIDGRLALSDLEELLGEDLSCEEACDTVGGYAFWAFGRIPDVNDLVEKDGIRLRVLAMDGRRVSRLEVRLTAETGGGDELSNASASLRGGR